MTCIINYKIRHVETPRNAGHLVYARKRLLIHAEFPHSFQVCLSLTSQTLLIVVLHGWFVKTSVVRSISSTGLISTLIYSSIMHINIHTVRLCV